MRAKPSFDLRFVSIHRVNPLCGSPASTNAKVSISNLPPARYVVMVRALLCLLAASLASAAAHEALELPAVDFGGLREDGALLDKLQRLGTVAVRDIPGYSELRRRYLAAAAACVCAHRSTTGQQEGVLYRVMDDGTERYTMLSLQGERDPLPDAICPEFHAAKREFSALVERAVEELSAAIDGRIADTYGETQAAFAADAASLSAVVSSGRHMDHFHAYMPRDSDESPFYPAADPSSYTSWTLNMHSDLGVFIAMAPPAYYEVVEDDKQETLRPIENPDPDSGLVIKKPTREIVRPEQRPDDLIVMVGDGFSAWTGLPVSIPAVIHGMVMPATCHSRPIVRAWFGKMVLPSQDFTLRSTNETFGVFTDRVNEYFSDLGTHAQRSLSEPEGFASVACSAMASASSATSMRRLLDAPTCAYRLCEPILNPDYKESCSFWCNLARTATNANNCAKHCRCSQNLLSENVFMCWSGCFEFINDCDQHYQTCIGDTNDATGYATVNCSSTPLTDEQRKRRAGMDADFSRFPSDTDDTSSASDGGEDDTSSESDAASNSDDGMSGMSDARSASDEASSSGSHVHDHDSMASMSGMRD